MKFSVLTAAVVLSASAGMGLLSYRYTSAPLLQAERTGDTMAWLRAEFKLSDEQYKKVAQLHREYGKICAEHCRAIQQATAAVDVARRASPLDPARVNAAEGHREEMKTICERSLETHVREVAACLPAEEAPRYLALVLSRISNYDHSGPPDLTLKRP